MTQPELRFVNCLDATGLHRMAYWEWAGPGADAPVLVCVHGLSRQGRDFDALARAMSDRYRVICPDVVGRGHSDWLRHPAGYQVPAYVSDMVALLARLDVAQVDWVGTSMGGLITMALTALRPKAVVAAILNDIGPEVAPEGLSRIAAYSGQPVEIDSWADAAAYAKRINAVAFPHYSDADWDAFARRIFRQGPDGEIGLDYDPDISVPIRAAGAKALVPNLWPMFRRLARNRPTLLVRGGVSDLLSADIAARMRKAAPDMAYVEVPQIGHAPMLDEPEAKAAIFEFLAELD